MELWGSHWATLIASFSFYSNQSLNKLNCDLPASASLNARIISVCHCTWLGFFFFLNQIREKFGPNFFRYVVSLFLHPFHPALCSLRPARPTVCAPRCQLKDAVPAVPGARQGTFISGVVMLLSSGLAFPFDAQNFHLPSNILRPLSIVCLSLCKLFYTLLIFFTLCLLISTAGSSGACIVGRAH